MCLQYDVHLKIKIGNVSIKILRRSSLKEDIKEPSLSSKIKGSLGITDKFVTNI